MLTPLYAKQAAKYITSQSASVQQRIRGAIAKLPAGDIKPLAGAPGNYRLRVGDWRILFSYGDADTVLIKKISPRGQAYKE